jgi:hypothetical protein
MYNDEHRQAIGHPSQALREGSQSYILFYQKNPGAPLSSTAVPNARPHQSSSSATPMRNVPASASVENDLDERYQEVSKHVASENRVDESLPELGTVFSVEPVTEGRTTMSIEPQTGLRDIAAGKKQKTGAKSAYVGEQDLDPEERAAFAEVARKGYYHGRPASDTTTSTPAPILISVSGDGGTDSHKRTEVDAFQRKWDKFDSDDFINNIECGDDMQEKPTGGPKLCSSYSKRQKKDGEQKKNGLGEY